MKLKSRQLRTKKSYKFRTKYQDMSYSSLAITLLCETSVDTETMERFIQKASYSVLKKVLNAK